MSGEATESAARGAVRRVVDLVKRTGLGDVAAGRDLVELWRLAEVVDLERPVGKLRGPPPRGPGQGGGEGQG